MTYSQDWEKKHKEYRQAYKKAWRMKNAEKIRAEKGAPDYLAKRKQQYQKKMERIDFRLEQALRARIQWIVKKGTAKKAYKTIELLGASIEEIRKHIESQFGEDMNWDKAKKGEIHIDHVIPVNCFDMTDKVEQKNAFFYKNLQPLWAKDNLSKGSRIRPQDLAKFLAEVGVDKLPRSLKERV